MNSKSALVATFIALLVLPACAGRWTGSDYLSAQPVSTEPDEQLAGESLEQQKRALRRTHDDLKAIQLTAQSLRRHRNIQGIEAFESFVQPFIADQVRPLLDEEPQWHPELKLLKANLMFAEAAVWLELRDSGRVSKVTRRIEKALSGEKNMLVEYPLGDESTVEQALRDLARGRGIL